MTEHPKSSRPAPTLSSGSRYPGMGAEQSAAKCLKIALIDPSLFTIPYDRKLGDALRSLGHDVIVYGDALSPQDAPLGSLDLRRVFYSELVSLGVRRWPRAALSVAKGAVHCR